MIIKALYDDKPCFLNADYIVDIFQENFNSYIAYTLDNEREGYVISAETFERLKTYKNSWVQDVRIVNADGCISGCRGSDDMGRYDHYTDSFIKE